MVVSSSTVGSRTRKFNSSPSCRKGILIQWLDRKCRPGYLASSKSVFHLRPHEEASFTSAEGYELSAIKGRRSNLFPSMGLLRRRKWCLAIKVFRFYSHLLLKGPDVEFGFQNRIFGFNYVWALPAIWEIGKAAWRAGTFERGLSRSKISFSIYVALALPVLRSCPDSFLLHNAGLCSK